MPKVRLSRIGVPDGSVFLPKHIPCGDVAHAIMALERSVRKYPTCSMRWNSTLWMFTGSVPDTVGRLSHGLFHRIVQALYNLADVRNPCLPSCGVGISMSCCFAPNIGHQLVRESLFVIGDAAGALNLSVMYSRCGALTLCKFSSAMA